jgi:dipeptidyl aminopeptidase/acylaminoacyl peptidase
MHKALERAGITSKFIEFEKTTHTPTLEQAAKGIEETLFWFNKYLKN